MMQGRVVESDIKVNAFTILDNPDVTKAIAHLKDVVKVNDSSTFDFKAFDIEYFEEVAASEETMIEQTTTYVKLSDEAQLRVISTKAKNGNSKFNVAAIHLGEKEGAPRVFTTTFENGEIGYTVARAYDEEGFKVPQDNNEIQAFIPLLDCIWGGSCCTLGGKKYNWCGLGCGSGTPINDLDTCCKWHDNCYTANSKYPARCTCDNVLIACAEGTNADGAGILIAAFHAKMIYEGC
ncbi:hypothetical protein [Lysinibacillus sp. RC79]|uniref:hypothetical protein n=1 Tax=Lysinibacillus sp. RC79 TaxID=3156296 RepID=UPI003517FA98